MIPASRLAWSKLDTYTGPDHLQMRRLPPDVDLRILCGDVPEGVEIISRGEPHDYRP